MTGVQGLCGCMVENPRLAAWTGSPGRNGSAVLLGAARSLASRRSSCCFLKYSRCPSRLLQFPVEFGKLGRKKRPPLRIGALVLTLSPHRR